MLAMTASFMLVELIVGHLTNSMALVADSFHMLSDVIALIIAYISVRSVFIMSMVFSHRILKNVSEKVDKEHLRLRQG